MTVYALEIIHLTGYRTYLSVPDTELLADSFGKW